MSPLPNGWAEVQLDAVASIRPGRTPRRLDDYLKANPRTDRVVPFFKVGDMTGDSARFMSSARTHLAFDELRRLGVEPVPSGTIVFPKAGGAIATNKKRTIHTPGAIDLNCMAVVPGPRVESDFLYYWFEALDLRNLADGSILPQISKRRVTELVIPLPPLEEQRRIIDILEDHLSRLDAAVEALRVNAARASVLADAVVRSEITGRSAAGPRVAAALASNGVDDGDLSPLPIGWTWVRLGDLADVVGGVTKDSKRQGDPSFVEVPYLRVANVQRGHLDLSTVTTIRVPPQKAEMLRLLPGDVLLNEGGDRDKLGRGWVWAGQIPDCIHQNHVFRARVRDGRIDPLLLSWAANTIGGRWCDRNGTQSVNLASISLRKIRLMPIPVPPAGDQAAIVRRVQDAIDATERLRTELQRGLVRAQSLRRALLDAAFSGRLTGVPSDMARVEESAGV